MLRVLHIANGYCIDREEADNINDIVNYVPKELKSFVGTVAAIFNAAWPLRNIKLTVYEGHFLYEITCNGLTVCAGDREDGDINLFNYDLSCKEGEAPPEEVVASIINELFKLTSKCELEYSFVAFNATEWMLLKEVEYGDIPDDMDYIRIDNILYDDPQAAEREISDMFNRHMYREGDLLRCAAKLIFSGETDPAGLEVTLEPLIEAKPATILPIWVNKINNQTVYIYSREDVRPSLWGTY